MKNASSKITLLLLVAVAVLFTGCSPLMYAAQIGDIKEVERLIAEGADVNARDLDGKTPLLYAASAGKKELAELLIAKGADVNAAWGGWTPLSAAVYYRRTDVVRLLIEKGADIDIALSKAKLLKSELFVDIKPTIALLENLAKEHKIAEAKVRREKAAAEAKEKAAAEAKAAAAEEAAFTEATASYRTATVKPTLPEEARKYKVQAEFAVGKKEFARAAGLYKAVLAGYPWWPEGRYNRALILGELSRYSEAIREMKRYLTLVPDGPYARTAQDKIYQWEGELK